MECIAIVDFCLNFGPAQGILSESAHFPEVLRLFRNHKAGVAPKLNELRIDGQPHNPEGTSFAPNVVNAHDELTKRQRPLLRKSFHGVMISRELVPALWGVYPIPNPRNPSPDTACWVWL